MYIPFEPNSAQMVAFQWLAAIIDDSDLARAWRLTSYNLRLTRAQTWCIDMGMSEHDGTWTAMAIASSAERHEHWGDFSDWAVRRWQQITFDQLQAGWGVYPELEIAGVDFVFVRAVAVGPEGRLIRAHSQILANTLILQMTGGLWQVAGIGRQLPSPGWPPQAQEIPSDRVTGTPGEA